MGLKITKAGGISFEIEPHTEYFDSFDCTLPAGEGEVRLVWDGDKLAVHTTAEGGILKYQGKTEKISVTPVETL